MSIVSDLLAGGVEGILGTLTKAVQVFKADATQRDQLDAAIEQTKLAIIQLGIQADISVQKAISEAIQAESKSEHWLQWSWRPLAAYTVYAITINNYILLPYLSKYGIQALSVPDSVYAMFLAILGVASWHRGVVKVEETKQGN